MQLQPDGLRDSASLVQDKLHILESLQGAVLCLGRDWRVTYANGAARRISQLPTCPLDNTTYWELFPADVGTELERRLHRVMVERVETQHIFFYDPLRLWIDQRIVPIESGIALLYQDVTAQKLEDGMTLSTSRHLGQVFDLTSDGILYLDRGYNFTFLNRRARELLSPVGEVIGTCIWDALPATRDEGSPYVESYRLSMEEKVSSEFEVFYPEPLNKWFCFEVRPADNGIIVFLRDATKAHIAADAVKERQLEAEQQRAEIETLYRTAPVGLALFDPMEFRYLRLNDRQAEFYGLRPEQILGQSVMEGAAVQGLRELFEQVAGGTPVRDQMIEGELTSRAGEYRYWTVNYYPIFKADGSVQAISAVSLEITQQKRAEAALLQSEKLAAVGRLATSISHEINNPLESITNLLYLIAVDPELSVSLKPYVTMAQGELARVSQIATQTLRFHRQSIRATWRRARQLVGGVLDLYGGRLINANVIVNFRYFSDTPFLCFENDVRQVLNNLIANAIDAMPEGGRLLVRSHDAIDPRSGQRGVRLTIADTGHGMSEATRKRACEPFYTTKDANGTGLGLWISAGIVARHGGRLSFRSSQHPAHRGTVFTVFQPLVIEGYEASNFDLAPDGDGDSEALRQDLAS